MRKLTTLFIVLLATITVNAQSSWGITGGKLFNNFNLGDEYSKSNSTINSYSLGLFYQIKVGKRSQLYATLTHDDKTTQTPDRLNKTNPVKQTLELNYLTLDMGYNLLIGKTQRFSTGAGIYYSKLQSNSLKVEGESQPINIANTSNYDMGLSLNCQYKVSSKINVMVKSTISSTYNIVYDPFTMPPSTFCATPYIANSRSISYSNTSLTIGVNYTMR